MVRLGMVRLGMAAQGGSSGICPKAVAPARGQRQGPTGRFRTSGLMVCKLLPPHWAIFGDRTSMVEDDSPNGNVDHATFTHHATISATAVAKWTLTNGPSPTTKRAGQEQTMTYAQLIPEARVTLAPARATVRPGLSFCDGCGGKNDRETEFGLNVTRRGMTVDGTETQSRETLHVLRDSENLDNANVTATEIKLEFAILGFVLTMRVKLMPMHDSMNDTSNVEDMPIPRTAAFARLNKGYRRGGSLGMTMAVNTTEAGRDSVARHRTAKANGDLRETPTTMQAAEITKTAEWAATFSVTRSGAGRC
jgi:hypothetical protein